MAADLPIEIFFFRTRHGLEVDFIVRLKDRLWAIEAKSGDVSDPDLSALRDLRRYGAPFERYAAVGPKEKRRKKDGILICDLATLLDEMGL